MGKEWWRSELLDTEGKDFSSITNSGLKKNSLGNTSNDKSFNEVFGSSFDDMPLRQQIETAYDYYDKPQSEDSGVKNYTLEAKPMGFAGQMKEKDSEFATLPKNRDCTKIDDIYYSRDGQINTKDHEGGYNFGRKNDAGGHTNYGISQVALDEYNSWDSPYRTGFDFPDLVKDLNETQAKKILEEKYLKRHAVDKICNKDIARNTFDILMSTTNQAPRFLAESLNKVKNTNFHDSDVVSDSSAAYINQNLTDGEVTQINDLLTQKGMDYYFRSVDKRPKNINNINGWYNRRRNYYSDPEKFDSLYKKQLEEYLKKYGAYYDGK